MYTDRMRLYREAGRCVKRKDLAPFFGRATLTWSIVLIDNVPRGGGAFADQVNLDVLSPEKPFGPKREEGALRTGTLKAKVAKEAEVDRVYRLLKGWILGCDFLPGDLLGELELAGRCQTSRTPIREACNRLSQEGWIARIPHKGYMVPAISIREIIEIYEFRKLLECFTAEKAARTASPDQIAELRRIMAVESRPEVEIGKILAANDAFHLGIGEIAHNQHVLDHLKTVLEYVHRLDILSAQRDAGWVPHEEILSALEAHKPSDARQAMAAHIDNARDRMLKLFGLTGI